jgi:hypothetical protein
VSATLEHRSLRYSASTGSPEPLLRRPRSRISTCEEIEKGRAYLRMSLTQRNSAMASFKVFQILRVFCVNLIPRARAGALSSVRGPAWASLAQYYSPFSFFFFCQT